MQMKKINLFFFFSPQILGKEKYKKKNRDLKIFFFKQNHIYFCLERYHLNYFYY